jgi:type I restriction enzyme S subunit
MAKRLYDYWFVQYDFPDKNGHPYKTTGGPMTYNPTLKRKIPTGWEVKTLKECIKHINTGLNPRDNFVLGNGDIKYVTVKNLTMEGNIDFSGCDFIDEDALKKVHKRSDIAKGDVLYASICPLGRSYLINKDPVGWDINESVFSIRPNLDVISSEFLSVFLKDSAVVEKASKMATGSIFKGIRIKELENMILAVPVKDVMEKFSKQIKNLIELEHKNTEQIAHLTTLRDKLLPLLMNGQVVVR